MTTPPPATRLRTDGRHDVFSVGGGEAGSVLPPTGGSSRLADLGVDHRDLAAHAVITNARPGAAVNS